MSVLYDYWTGHADERLLPLKRCISGFTRLGRRKFKIGVSSNPNRRWQEEYQGRYDRMLVIYSTNSDRSIRMVEKELTLHYKHWADNKILGGGGPSSSGPYYLYVVLKEKQRSPK